MTSAARLALATHLGVPPSAAEGIRAWSWEAYELARRVGGDAFVRLVIAAARAAHSGPVPQAAAEAIRSAEAWLSCPCSRHADAAWAARTCAFAAGPLDGGGIEPGHKAAGCAAIAAYLVDRQASPVLAADAVWFAVSAATKLRPTEEVASAMLAAMRPWLLTDPDVAPERREPGANAGLSSDQSSG